MDSVVKMKSLPFDATQLDIIQFFETFKLKPNGVQLVVRSDNKPTGEAFVDFESHEEAGRAMREKDHKVFHEKFGDRYVRLIQVRRHPQGASGAAATLFLPPLPPPTAHLTGPGHMLCVGMLQHVQSPSKYAQGGWNCVDCCSCSQPGVCSLLYWLTAAHTPSPPASCCWCAPPRCRARRCRRPCRCALAARASSR